MVLDDYFDVPKVSASYLKGSINSSNPMSIEKYRQKDTSNKATNFGSLVDCLYTEDHLFEKKYAIIDSEIGSDACKIVDEVFKIFLSENSNKSSLEDFKDQIKEICEKPIWGIKKDSPYYGKNAATTGVNKVLKQENYFQQLIANKNKIIIDTATLKIAERHIYNVRKRFKKLNYVLQNYASKQIVFNSEFKGVLVKGKLDFLIHFDTDVEYDGIIFKAGYWNIDLKTTSSSLLSYSHDILKYRNDISTALYDYMIKKEEKTDVVNHALLVVNEYAAGLYLFDPKELLGGMNGWNVNGNGKYTPCLVAKEDACKTEIDKYGIEQLMYQYNWYEENGYNQHWDLKNNIIQNLYLG